MDFDEVLTEIGEFGKYQRRIYFLICLPVMFGAANSLSYVFTAGIPKYRCFIPECDDHIDPVLHVDWIKNATPGITDIYGDFTPEQCLRYPTPERNESRTHLGNVCPAEWFLNTREVSCKEWVFDKDERTIVQEWNITCQSNAWKLAMVGTVHFAGLVAGTASSGFLADRYGRKLIFTFNILFMSVTGILQAAAWDYMSFLIFAFLNAVGTSGVYPLAFIIGVEMVGPGKREMASIVLNYFYAVGEALVGMFAWWCKDWQWIQYGLSAPPLIFGLYYWLVPESVRWLLAKKEYAKAEKIIKKAARINSKTLSECLLASFEKGHVAVPDENGKVFIIDAESEDSKKHEMRRTLKLALQSRIMMLRFLLLLYIWATNAFVYYGLSLNSTSLSGNKYINFILVCLIEIPGYCLAWISMNKIGRRWSSAGSLLLCAFTCAAGGFVNQDLSWAVITLFLIGKLGVTSSFSIIYTHTAEMLPTIIRSAGVGCMSTVARFGAMIAPFVPLLGIYFKPLPLLVFGAVSLMAGLLVFILPETFKTKLPDTVEEAERLGKEQDLKL